MPVAQLEQPNAKLRWFQFSLRTLLVVMLVCGCGLGILGVKVERARRQSAAAAFIAKSGGEVLYDYQCDASGNEVNRATRPDLAWYQKLVGSELFDRVVQVRVRSDDQLKFIGDLPELDTLQFFCSPEITDKGLSSLRDAPQIRHVRFGMHDQVTDAGLANLAALKDLQTLNIEYLPITDGSLPLLTQLNHLQELTLDGHGLSPEGRRKLKQALPHCTIEGD